MIARRQPPAHDRIRPTASQVQNNIVGIPRTFVEQNRAALRWSSGFDVIVKGQRATNRRLDRENRIGGLPLRGHVTAGEVLRLSIQEGALVLAAEQEPPSGGVSLSATS